MPLARYEIRNEYSLANPDLYRAAAKDDPEGLLEGVAMAGLVGIVRQLGDLAEFAAEVFHDLHEEILATAARGHGLMLRVQQLEAELPFLENMMLGQSNGYHGNFAYNSGVGWHAVIHNDQNHFTQGDLPRFIRNAYEECRSPPRLFLLDKFDVAGAGACLKRYTDPSFFKMEWASSELMKAEKEQQDKRARRMKEKKKIKRQRNGEIKDAGFGSQLQARVHLPESDINNLETENIEPPVSEAFVSMQKESIQSDASKEPSVFEQQVYQRNATTVDVPEKGVMSESPKWDNVRESSESMVDRSKTVSEDGIPPKESTSFTIKDLEDGTDDVASEAENFLDALTTMDSEAETDTEVKIKSVREFILEEISTNSSYSENINNIVKESEDDTNLDEETMVNMEFKSDGKNPTHVASSSLLSENAETNIADGHLSPNSEEKNKLSSSQSVDDEHFSSQQNTGSDNMLEDSVTDDKGYQSVPIDNSNVGEQNVDVGHPNVVVPTCDEDVFGRPTLDERIDLAPGKDFPEENNEAVPQVSENITLVEAEVPHQQDNDQETECRDAFVVDGMQENVITKETTEIIGDREMNLATGEGPMDQHGASFTIPEIQAIISKPEDHLDHLDSEITEHIDETPKTSDLVEDENLEMEDLKTCDQQNPDSSNIMICNGSQDGIPIHFTSSTYAREDMFHGGDFSFFASDLEDSDNEQSESSKQASSPHSSADSIIQPMRWTVDFSRAHTSSSDTDDEMGDMQVSSAPSSSSSTLSSPRPSALVTTVFNVDPESNSDSVLSPGRSLGSSPVSPLGSPPESPLSSAGVVLTTAASDTFAGFAKTDDTPSNDALETSNSTDNAAHQLAPVLDHELSCKSKLDPFIASDTSADHHPQCHHDTLIQQSGFSVEVPPPPPLPQSHQDTSIQPSGFSAEEPPPPPLPPLQWRLIKKVRSAFSSPSAAPPIPQNLPAVTNKIEKESDRPLESFVKSNSHFGQQQTRESVLQPQTSLDISNEQDTKLAKTLPEIFKSVFIDSRHSATGTSGSAGGDYSVDASIETHLESLHNSTVHDKGLEVPRTVPHIPPIAAVVSTAASLPSMAPDEVLDTVEVSVKTSDEPHPSLAPLDRENTLKSTSLLKPNSSVERNEQPAGGSNLDRHEGLLQVKSIGVLPDPLAETMETVLVHTECDFHSPGDDEHVMENRVLARGEDLKPSVRGPVDQKLSENMSNDKQLENVSQLQSSIDLQKNRMDNYLQKATAASSKEISTVHDNLSDSLEVVKKNDNHNLKEHYPSQGKVDESVLSISQSNTLTAESPKTLHESADPLEVVEKNDNHNLKEHYPSQGKVDEPVLSKSHSNTSTAESLKTLDVSANKSSVSKAEVQDPCISTENPIEESRPKFLSKFERKDSLIKAIATHDRSTLKKVPDRTQSSKTEPVDDRGILLEQIRNRSFSLRHTKVEKQPAPRPVTNINVAAILEKANAIRQAFAGSDEDEDDDDWSDD